MPLKIESNNNIDVIKTNAASLLKTISIPYTTASTRLFIETKNFIKNRTLPKTGKKFILMKIILDYRNPNDTNNDFTIKLDASLISLNRQLIPEVIEKVNQTNGLFALYDADLLSDKQISNLLASRTKSPFNPHSTFMQKQLFIAVLKNEAMLHELLFSNTNGDFPIINDTICNIYDDPNSIAINNQFVKCLKTLLTLKEYIYKGSPT